MNLFQPQVPQQRLHKHFLDLVAKRRVWNMDVLQDWARGFYDRDGKFVTEFQTTFNSSFWELYLFAMLKEYKKYNSDFEISLEHYAPDFYLPKLNIAIEATIASNANNSLSEDHFYNKSVDEIDFPDDLNKFNQYAMVRLSNSIMSKFIKYQEAYCKLPHMQDVAYIIALQDFSQPFGHMGCGRAIEAVLYNYYVDEQEFLNSPNESGLLKGEYLGSILKGNGSQIELGFFADDRFSDISAIIFNPCVTMGKVTALSNDPSNILFSIIKRNLGSVMPNFYTINKLRYEEHLLDGLIVYHNPYAKRPINPEIFNHHKVDQVAGVFNGEKMGLWAKDFLCFRSVLNMHL